MWIHYQKTELYQFFHDNSEFLKLLSILMAIIGLILSFSNKFPNSENIFWAIVCLLILSGLIWFFIGIDAMNRIANKKIESALDIIDASFIFISIMLILAPICLIGSLIFENYPEQIYWGLFGFLFYLILVVFSGIMEFIDVNVQNRTDAIIFAVVFIILLSLLGCIPVFFSTQLLSIRANILLLIMLGVGIILNMRECILKLFQIKHS